MIPVSLTLKGLYSYQEEQTIKFDRLIEGQLFGIFGAVGSGKSSILEAISFALYGQTERLDNRDNRNYNMMNLKSNELLIDFTFQNFDGHLYRYTVKGKRHGKDFEKVNTFDRAAYKWVDEKWVPLESSLAESVIGLSYDNFRRTIIIPQGKFQEFLQLGHAHRTQMLKEIFQLGKYEFFNQTKNLEYKNNSALQHLTGQLSTYSEIEAEKIKKKKEELKDIAKSLKIKKEDFELKSEVVKGLLELKTLFENLDAQKEIVSNLQKSEGSFNELEEKVKNADYCLAHFKNGLDRSKELQEGIVKRKKSLMDVKALQQKTVSEIESLKEPLRITTEEYLKQEVYKEKLQDYHHLINLVRLRSDRNKLQGRIEKGKAVIDGVLNKRTDIENKQTLLKKELQEKNALKPNMKELVDLRAWFDKKINLEDNIQNAVFESDRLSHELSVLQNKLLSILNENNFFEDKRELSFENLNKQLIDVKADKQSIIQQLEEEIEHFKIQLKLSEFTDALKRGEACPLCGSVEHKFVLEVEDVQAHLQKAQQIHQGLESELSAFQTLENELQLHESKIDFINGQLAHAHKKVEESKSNLADHIGTFKGLKSDSNGYNQVIEQINGANLLEDAIKKLDEKGERYQEELRILNKEYDRYNESLDQLKKDLQTATIESSTLIKQLKQHEETDILTFEESVLKILSEELSAKISIDKERYEELSNSFKKLKEEELKASVQIESIQVTLQVENESFHRIQEQLEEKLKVSPFNNWEIVTNILEEDFNIDKEKQQIEAYKLQVYSAKDRLSALRIQVEGKLFDQVKYDGLVMECNVMKEEITQLNDQFISEKSIYDGWVVQLAAKDRLLIELKQLEHRSENIKTMRQLFMANGFINYISTVYLQNLCHVANERFYQLTRQQLRLELSDKNEFLIRDFMNNGKLRSVKTLSGGQTFQASLCLALALAESVQQQNKSKQNFFFLDEGFGSLDKESLQMAFETLKALRKENRIVGIISHVEELQQEIDVYLKVENDSFTGSKISNSWERLS